MFSFTRHQGKAYVKCKRKEIIQVSLFSRKSAKENPTATRHKKILYVMWLADE